VTVLAQDQNANSFFATVQTQSAALVTLLQTLETLTERLAQDSTLAGRAATQANQAGYTTLAAADYTNWSTAIGQILFAFTSGTPTQSSLIYKML
jgi:hypothetical protein